MRTAKTFFAPALCAFLFGALPAFAAGDLITADKTLLVQLALFLAALYIMNRLFFKPLIELAERREKATSGSGKSADELLEKARSMSAQYDSAARRARGRALSERARITKSALAEADEIVSSAREEARRRIEERKLEIAAQTARAKSEARAEAEDIAALIIRAVRGDSGGV